MTIVVLDGFTLNPGDLSWDDLKSLAPCEIYDRTAPLELAERTENKEILLTNKTNLEHGERSKPCRTSSTLASWPPAPTWWTLRRPASVASP